jgi:hypothetical protein
MLLQCSVVLHVVCCMLQMLYRSHITVTVTNYYMSCYALYTTLLSRWIGNDSAQEKALKYRLLIYLTHTCTYTHRHTHTHTNFLTRTHTHTLTLTLTLSHTSSHTFECRGSRCRQIMHFKSSSYVGERKRLDLPIRTSRLHSTHLLFHSVLLVSNCFDSRFTVSD